MADSEFIFKALTVMAASFPSNKITKETIEAYTSYLEDLDAPLLEAAIKECASTCEFFPTIRAIRDTAARLALGDRLEAMEAWGLVKKAAQHGNYDRPPDFGNPLVNRCAAIIGWRDFLNSDVDQEPSWRARFIEIYNQLREKEVREVRSLPQVREYRQLATDAIKQLAEQKRIR